MPDAAPEIAVPGSTSNLGPGFDALSIAVDLYLRIRVVDVAAREDGALQMVFGGAAPSGENRIETAFRHARARYGVPAAGLSLEVSSDIPMTAGLGSSAAASVGGLLLYGMAAGLSLTNDDVLLMATELEGHPDNAAAALLGGITVSCQTDEGRVIARSWPWPDDIRMIVATPERTLATTAARAVLPETIPLRDAVANLQRALLLVRAIETSRHDDLREALKDRWHQPAREPLVPGLKEALALEDRSILGACLSGAGPSVVAFARPGYADQAAAALGGVYRRLGVPHTIRTLAAHQAAMPTPPTLAALREKTA